MLRGIYGDPERFRQAYWSRWNDGTYFTGDGARRDEDGYYWLLGRVDDVLNVAGHRLGHDGGRERARRPSQSCGGGRRRQATRDQGSGGRRVRDAQGRRHKATPALADELKEHVARKIGAIARPDQILFAADLPKTRSGKIMRRLLRDIAEGKALGDTTTLADPAVVVEAEERVRGKRRIGWNAGPTWDVDHGLVGLFSAPLPWH